MALMIVFQSQQEILSYPNIIVYRREVRTLRCDVTILYIGSGAKIQDDIS